MGTSQVRRHVQPISDDVDDNDDLYDTRTHSSVRRYRTTTQIPAVDVLPRRQSEKLIPQRRASLKTQKTNGPRTGSLPKTEETSSTRKRALLVTIGLGMVLMVLVVMGLRALFSWWQVYQDDLHYGRPRISQLDAVVGHNDSPSHMTHFIFLNLHRHIEIIEIPGGDSAHTRIYNGPVLFGGGDDLTPVTGEIRAEAGRQDLIVHIQDQQLVFINDGTTFHLQS